MPRVTGTQALLQEDKTPLTDTDCATMEKHHRMVCVLFCLKIPPLLPRVYPTPARVRTGLMCAPTLMHAPPRLLACCHEGTLLAHAQLSVHHEAFCTGAFQLVGPACYPSLGLSLPKGRTLPFFLELQEIPAGSFLQPREALPNSSTAIWCISHSSWFGVIYKTAPSTRSLMQMEK